MFEAYRNQFRIEKERINWVDQLRGLFMFGLALLTPFPKALLGNDPLTAFIFVHPPKEAPWMSISDIGVPGFLFIIGVLYPLSFLSRMEKKGPGKAILYAILRWGSIYVAGVLIIFLTRSEGLGEIKEIAPGVEMFVVSWDIIDAIGFVGLMCIPFMFLQRKSRLLFSYGMMGFYQAMLFIPSTYWRKYAVASSHGGILGGIFVMSPIVLIGSCVGEYCIMERETPKSEKNKKLAVFAAINLAIGLTLWAVPGGYPNKWMSTMSWAVISLTAAIIGMFVFILTDYETENYPKLNPANRFRIVLFKAYGRNPLLTFILSGFAGLFVAGLPTELQLALWPITVTAISTIVYSLHRKNKQISTTKVALILIILIVLVLLFSNVLAFNSFL